VGRVQAVGGAATVVSSASAPGILAKEGSRMDAERFDGLTRLLTQTVSKRQVLVGLLGGVASTLLARAGAGAQGCTSDDECAMVRGLPRPSQLRPAL
jgi:hypothetical protein